MTGPELTTSRDDDAERMWLARAVTGPDAWRSRATSAAGLLSAAAAASVAGLLLRADQLPADVRGSATFGAAAYVGAVIAYLIASVLPSPKNDEETDNYADGIWDLCEKEAKRIRRSVWVGTGLAALAVAATGYTVLLTVEHASEDGRSGKVLPVSRDATRALEEACPGVKAITGEVAFPQSDVVRIHVGAETCGTDAVDLEVRRADVLVLLDSE